MQRLERKQTPPRRVPLLQKAPRLNTIVPPPPRMAHITRQQHRPGLRPRHKRQMALGVART